MTSSYDPEARRETPLLPKLQDLIRRNRSISTATYMECCLSDDEHGYYKRQQAIGTSGDFITAPEISQIFGELIGLWAVVVWQQMGSPQRFRLIELGPGRGTLMCDALRAACAMPGLNEALEVCLVEINPLLIAQQQSSLSRAANLSHPPRWFDDAAAIAEGSDEPVPSIIVGNEFLDTFAPTQFVRGPDSWHRRDITLDDNDRLVFAQTDTSQHVLEPNLAAKLNDLFATAKQGDIVELNAWESWPTELLSTDAPTAALFIDYGHTDATVGDTFQAVRDHMFEHPLTSPGEADLTAQVDFSQFACKVRSHHAGIEVDAPTTQAEFLGRLGIIERASRLMSANPDKAVDLQTGVMRLMSPQGMGGRFKAIGIRSNDLPVLPGFQ